jgi:hypothetical protein
MGREKEGGGMTIELPGWTCPSCLAFNGDAKERLAECRACCHPRPGGLDESFARLQATTRAVLVNLDDVQNRASSLMLENQKLKQVLRAIRRDVDPLVDTDADRAARVVIQRVDEIVGARE